MVGLGFWRGELRDLREKQMKEIKLRTARVRRDRWNEQRAEDIGAWKCLAPFIAGEFSGEVTD